MSADDRTRRPRRAATSTSRSAICGENVPDDAMRLFGERMLPVVSPALAQRSGDAAREARRPRAATCCCTSTIPRVACRGSTGRPGSPPTAQPRLKPPGSLRFTLYDQVIQAAVGGQGVALGRMPLIAELLRDGRLVAPFPKRYDSPRGYYALVAPHARDRPDVDGVRRHGCATQAAAIGDGSAGRPRQPRAQGVDAAGRARSSIATA